jgi:hypothetical protein
LHLYSEKNCGSSGLHNKPKQKNTKTMSWSIYAMCKAPAVSNKVQADLSKYKMAEPEEAIKNKLGEVICDALREFPENAFVNVEASGSQSVGSDGKSKNTFTVKVEEKWMYVE